MVWDLISGLVLVVGWALLAAMALVFIAVVLGGKLIIKGPARGSNNGPYCEKCNEPLDVSVLSFATGARIEWDMPHKCKKEGSHASGDASSGT